MDSHAPCVELHERSITELTGAEIMHVADESPEDGECPVPLRGVRWERLVLHVGPLMGGAGRSGLMAWS